MKKKIFASIFVQLISYIAVKCGRLGSDVTKGFWCVPVSPMHYEKIQPLVDFTRRRKAKTLLSAGLTKVNVFDQLQMKMLYLNTPSRPIIEILTIAMKGVQLSVDFDPFLFVSPLLPQQM